MNQIIIGNVKYNIHPQYISFGVDRNGNVIDIVTRKTINVNEDKKTIRLRKFLGRSNNIKIKQYVWEAYNGVKPKELVIMHINGNDQDNRIDNLKLTSCRKKRRYSSDEETREHNKMKNDIWRKKEWVCPKCGKVTRNTSKSYHKRVCPSSGNRHKGVDKRKLKDGDVYWKNKMFKCYTCNKEYKNNYKYLHTILCEKKNRSNE